MLNYTFQQCLQPSYGGINNQIVARTKKKLRLTYLHLSKIYLKLHAVKPKCLVNGIINDLLMLHLQN